jgi:hypothetical protein
MSVTKFTEIPVKIVNLGNFISFMSVKMFLF